MEKQIQTVGTPRPPSAAMAGLPDMLTQLVGSGAMEQLTEFIARFERMETAIRDIKLALIVMNRKLDALGSAGGKP